MGLLTSLLTLPVSGPVRSALWIAAKVHEAADAELRNPAAIRQALASLEADLEAGRIDEDAFEEAEAVLLDRLKGPAAP